MKENLTKYRAFDHYVEEIKCNFFIYFLGAWHVKAYCWDREVPSTQTFRRRRHHQPRHIRVARKLSFTSITNLKEKKRLSSYEINKESMIFLRNSVCSLMEGFGRDILLQVTKFWLASRCWPLAKSLNKKAKREQKLKKNYWIIKITRFHTSAVQNSK